MISELLMRFSNRRLLFWCLVCLLSSWGCEERLATQSEARVRPVAPERPSYEDPAVAPIRDPAHPCGPVCIAVVAKIHGRSMTLAEASRLAPPDALGRNSMTELVTALRSADFGAIGVHLDPAAGTKVPYPMIAFVHNSHFAVIVGDGSDWFVYLDPPAPPSRRSLSSLRDIWDGTAIIVAPAADEIEIVLQELGVTGVESVP
jgi:ABC-type bacteriocin/lantibiotic exporter with double-glycine peptidase domain